MIVSWTALIYEAQNANGLHWNNVFLYPSVDNRLDNLGRAIVYPSFSRRYLSNNFIRMSHREDCQGGPLCFLRL